MWIVKCERFYHQAVWGAGVEGLNVSGVDFLGKAVAAEEADRLEHVLCEVWTGAYYWCDMLTQEIAAAGGYRGLMVDDGPRNRKEAFGAVRIYVNFVFYCCQFSFSVLSLW